MSAHLGDRMKSPANEPNRHSLPGLRPGFVLKCFTSSWLSSHLLCTLLCILIVLLQFCEISARRSVVAPNFSLSPPKVNRARIQYKTTYACEHRELQLSCEPNESIHLVRANYGRFSLSICNEGGRLDLSVMCMSYRSFLIMTDRCSNKSNCSVVVSSKLFGDPCPGTAKYLEVQYHCVQGGASSQSTRRPHEESRLLGNMSSVNLPINSAVPTTTNAPMVQINSKNQETTSSPSLVPATSTPSSIITQLPSEANSSEKSFPEPEVKVPLTYSTSSPANILPAVEQFPLFLDPSFVLDQEYCQYVFTRSLVWNYTKRGQISTQKCPGGATGTVRWECTFNEDTRRAEWFPLQPDFSECRSLWLDNLEERLSNDEPVIRITNELAQMTLTKMLYSDDLQRISRLIHQSLEHAMTSIQNLQPVEVWHRHQVLKELLMFVVETISNLLGNAQDDAWLDLSIASRKEVASSLIKSLENSALLLADNTNHDGSSAIAKPNVLVSVHVLDTRIPISLQFPTYEDTSGTNEWARMDDSIFLPAQSLADHAQDGLAKVAFFAYYRIEDLLKPSLQTDMGKFNSIMDSKLHNLSQSYQLSINSRVIGAAISHNGQMEQLALSQPVTIVLRHLQEENTSPQCVYWNMNSQNWLTDGCHVQSTNSTHTVCMCNHLTHFALLNQVKSSSDLPVELRFEKTLALVGCLLALCILAFASALIFMTPTGSTVSSSIHRNLCLTLFLFGSTYSIGLFCSDNVSVLPFDIAFLHYCLMCSFFWIFFESFDIYMNVNSIYEHFKSSKRLHWYYVIAYVSPLLICLVCFFIDSNCYRNFATIWLNSNNYVYLIMIGPAIGLFLASLAFILFSYILTRNHVIATTTIKCFEDIRVGGSRSLICWITFLLIFQTINWSCALAYLTRQDSLFAAILLTVSNVCASIFIFVFCIVKIENVQHSRLFRHLPFSLCQENSQLSSTKNSTTSDVYSTRPVVTQVTSTQVNAMNVHTPLGHSPSTPTATSPMSMSPCLPQMHPLPISHSTHWNYPPEMCTRSTILDHQSILAAQDPSCLLFNFNPTHQIKTLPREVIPSHVRESYVESNLKNPENVISKKKGKNAQTNLEFASLHRPGNISRKPFVVNANENKYTIQAHSGVANFAPNLDHIYESIDSESISSTLYEQNRRLNMHNMYGANYRSKSTVNDDDLSSSSIYEDKPLLFANNSSFSSTDHSRSKRIFIPHHYHSNASIYDKAPKDKMTMENHVNPATNCNAVWQFASKDATELPDLLQKSNGANNLLVSYSGDNRFLNKVVNSSMQ